MRRLSARSLSSMEATWRSLSIPSACDRRASTSALVRCRGRRSHDHRVTSSELARQGGQPRRQRSRTCGYRSMNHVLVTRHNAGSHYQTCHVASEAPPLAPPTWIRVRKASCSITRSSTVSSEEPRSPCSCNNRSPASLSQVESWRRGGGGGGGGVGRERGGRWSQAVYLVAVCPEGVPLQGVAHLVLAGLPAPQDVRAASLQLPHPHRHRDAGPAH